MLIIKTTKINYLGLITISVLIVFLYFTAAFAGEPGQLIGQVTDASTGNGIGDASVNAIGGGSTVTNPDGSYLMVLPAGTYTVTVDASGYEPIMQAGISIPEAVTVVENFQLSPAPKLDAVYPTLGVRGPNGLGVTLKGSGFDGNTRVSMAVDVGQKRAILGDVDTSDYVLDVAVVGSIAYIPDNYNGLRVIDVSDSSKPTIIGTVPTTPGSARSVAVLNKIAYVSSSIGLHIIDVDPSSSTYLTIIDSVPTPSLAWDVVVSNGKAYVACYESGLQIIDIDPDSSTYIDIIGDIDTPDHARGIAVEGNIACVADRASGIQIIDISTPSSPVLLGSKDTGNAYGVSIKDKMAYIAGSGNGLQIVDVDPASVNFKNIVGSVDTPGVATGLAVEENTTYVADGSTGYLVVIDTSDISNPTILGFIDTPGSAMAVMVQGDRAYVANFTEGLQIIDIRNPPLPTVLGSLELPDSGPIRIVLEDSIAYLAAQTRLEILDVSDASNPSVIRSKSIRATGVFVKDGKAYVAAWEDGLKIVDVNPSSPTYMNTIGAVITPGFAIDVAVSGNYAYVGDADYWDNFTGLRIIDINPSSSDYLKIIGEEVTMDSAEEVVVVGSTAYVAVYEDFNSALYVVDVSTPSAPTIIGSTPTPAYAYGVTVINNIAYVANGLHGLKILDVDPNSTDFCKVIGSVDTPGRARKVTVIDNIAYVADYGAGIQKIDVSNPSSPVIIGSVGTIAKAYDVEVSGDIAYVADGQGGFVTVPVPKEIDTFTYDSTSISLTLPSPDLAGHYTLRVFKTTLSDELAGAVTFTDDSSILNSKAIIVAGGGPNASGGNLWEETKQCANKAYDTLILQGYEHDSIYYFSMEALNDYVDYSDPNTMMPDLSDAINVWAADATQLLLYFGSLYSMRMVKLLKLSALRIWMGGWIRYRKPPPP
jgi:hypothetical protein